MKNLDEIMQAISIGLVVATFLLNTGRALKTIDLCKESLFFLNQPLKIEEQITKRLYEAIYRTMFHAYSRISDNTNAITYGKKLLIIYRERGDRVQEGKISMRLTGIYWSQSMYSEAKEVCERAIIVKREVGDRAGEATCYGNLGAVLQSLKEYVKARQCLEKAVVIVKEIGDRAGEAECYRNLGAVFKSLREYVKAKECVEKAHVIVKEIGDKVGEAVCYRNLGTMFRCLREYDKATECLEKALVIAKEIGDKEGEADCYTSLGTVLQPLGEYDKAKEYLEKALVIFKEIGHEEGEAACYRDLAAGFEQRGEYVKATEYLKKALVIIKEIGDKEGEAFCYGNLAAALEQRSEYVKATEYLKKALVIIKEIDDKEGEAACYENLAVAFEQRGEYVKATEYREKALVIIKEIGDKKGEATCYGNLAVAFEQRGEYFKAAEYRKKAFVIIKEIGDKKGEALCYGNLAVALEQRGEYFKAAEYLEKELTISREIGDRVKEAGCYTNLGIMFHCLRELVKAKEYLEKALAIFMEVGDRRGVARSSSCLANVWTSLRNYRKAKEYLDEALATSTEIGDRLEVARCYSSLGVLLHQLGDNVKAEEYHEKSLEMALEIGDRKLAALNYKSLGATFLALGKHAMAEECFEKALSVGENTVTDPAVEYDSYHGLAETKLSQKRFLEAFFYLLRSIAIYEKMRRFNVESDQLKISLADGHVLPYQTLNRMLYASGKPEVSLYVAELGRARALADLMATQYSAEIHISADPQSWIGIKNVMKKQGNCTLLYISYNYAQEVFLWILKGSGAIYLRKIEVDEKTLQKRLVKVARNLDEYFAIMAESFRSFGILREEVCEDRSLNDIEPERGSCQEENVEPSRQGKPGNTDDPKPSLTLLYEMPEIIIVPEGGLYRVPFPALLSDRGKYLSETFRIRVVPSLTTLKLIQDSPADYHSQTGVLVVGDPDVGVVTYRKERKKEFLPLPGARKETEMIGRMLGVEPLIGQQATKQAALERLRSGSLIHIAAHGNAEKGEIALAPPGSITGIPQEDDYLLKMSDISQVQVRAKLVVLSCCHSGLGQIRVEGVVGIARAFLGSGARSVLVALWALDDSATEQFMSRFYGHLVRGESASESLHHATKWMRDNGFIEVREWAPFMLMGDNVSFAFAK